MRWTHIGGHNTTIYIATLSNMIISSELRAMIRNSDSSLAKSMAKRKWFKSERAKIDRRIFNRGTIRQI